MSLAARTKGRVVRLAPVISCRDLEPAEVVEYLSRENGSKPSPLQRLSSRHRQIAKYIASGARTSDTAAKFGLSISRVSILKGDPTFQDLVRFYSGLEEDKHVGLLEVLEGLATDSVTTLIDRMEEDAEQFTTQELVIIAKMAADRSGHAPRRIEEKSVTINFGDRLDEARKRAKERLVEGTFTDVTPEKVIEDVIG